MPRRRLSPEEKKENMKQACSRWRQNNRDHYNAYMKTAMMEWTMKNREKYNKSKRDYYRWKKISQTFRDILLD